VNEKLQPNQISERTGNESLHKVTWQRQKQEEMKLRKVLSQLVRASEQPASVNTRNSCRMTIFRETIKGRGGGKGTIGGKGACTHQSGITRNSS